MKTTSSPTFSGALFTWTDSVGVTEASTLGFEPGRAAHVVRVVSHRSGTVASFLFNRFDQEGTAHYTGITFPGVLLQVTAD